jgi:hypothetical protein
MADIKINVPANDATPVVQDTKVENSVAEKTYAQEREEDLDAEYIDKRDVTISLIKNYSNYRQANMSVLGQRSETIGSSITSSRTLAANKGEVEAYFPNILGISANNESFVERVKQYLNNIQMVISSNDIKLNTTFIYNHKRDYLAVKEKEDKINAAFDNIDRSRLENIKQALDTKLKALNELESSKYKFGYPQNTEEYLMYRHCLLYNDVVKDMALYNSANKSQRFYIKDENKEKERTRKLLNERNIAKRHYIEMLGDTAKFNSMYIEYCVTNNMKIVEAMLKDNTEKELLLDKFSTDSPDKFNKMFADKNLNVKAFVENLIARGELIRLEYNQNITTSTGEFIGANMNEAVAYFNNPANADVRKAYENKLKLF